MKLMKLLMESLIQTLTKDIINLKITNKNVLI